MSEANLTAHKPGRRAFEIAPRKWPVVTRESLRHVQELGAVSAADENPLVTPLLKGLVWCGNVELQLRAALRQVNKRRDDAEDAQEPERWEEARKLVRCLEAQLARIQQIKEEWPLEVVG